jgi:hypothetical protein
LSFMKTTCLLPLLILLLLNIVLLNGHDQYLQYKILLPNGNIAYMKTHICGSCMLVLNKTIYVHIIYNEEFFKGYNFSKQYTELKMTIGGELETYNTIHIFYKNKTYAYELYYELNKKILLYGIITNTLTGEEYNIILNNNLESITWSTSITRSNTSETTIQISTTNSITGTNTTTSFKTVKTPTKGEFTSIFTMLLYSLIIVLIGLIIIFSIARKSHGKE